LNFNLAISTNSLQRLTKYFYGVDWEEFAFVGTKHRINEADYKNRIREKSKATYMTNFLASVLVMGQCLTD
jgi:hypothetical protein